MFHYSFCLVCVPCFCLRRSQVTGVFYGRRNRHRINMCVIIDVVRFFLNSDSAWKLKNVGMTSEKKRQLFGRVRARLETAPCSGEILPLDGCFRDTQRHTDVGCHADGWKPSVGRSPSRLARSQDTSRAPHLPPYPGAPQHVRHK